MNGPTDLPAPLLWAAATFAWVLFAIAFYGSPGFGTNPSQPILALVGLTLVIRYLMRGVPNALPISALVAPIAAFLVLMVIATVV